MARNVKALRPFEIVYSIAFMLLICVYVIDQAFHQADLLQTQSDHSLLTMTFYMVIVLGSSFQLMRMYYYLHDFEKTILRAGNHHFLEILPSFYQITEKIIRLLLATVLVLFSKVTSLMTPQLVIGLCFVLLVLWDVFVWWGFSKVEDTDLTTNGGERDTLKNFRYFYYIKKRNYSKDNVKIRNYFSWNWKFGERLCGLLAATTAYVTYLVGGTDSHDDWLWVPLILIVVLSILVVVCWYQGILESEQKLKRTPIRIFACVVAPLFTVLVNLGFVNDVE